MGILGKLKFWGKKDDLGLGEELALPKQGNLPADELGLQRQEPQMAMEQALPRMDSFQGANY